MNKVKKIFGLCHVAVILCTADAMAFQMQSQRELGTLEAKNQNIVVACTTVTGKLSSETCSLRRFAKCNKDKCDGWEPWKDLRNPGKSYTDWRAGASECCKAKGLR